MKTENVQKINWGYLLGYILGPIIVVALSFVIGRQFFAEGGS